jgi:hypothetical protein
MATSTTVRTSVSRPHNRIILNTTGGGHGRPHGRPHR